MELKSNCYHNTFNWTGIKSKDNWNGTKENIISIQMYNKLVV